MPPPALAAPWPLWYPPACLGDNHLGAQAVELLPEAAHLQPCRGVAHALVLATGPCPIASPPEAGGAQRPLTRAPQEGCGGVKRCRSRGADPVHGHPITPSLHGDGGRIRVSCPPPQWGFIPIPTTPQNAAGPHCWVQGVLSRGFTCHGCGGRAGGIRGSVPWHGGSGTPPKPPRSAAPALQCPCSLPGVLCPSSGMERRGLEPRWSLGAGAQPPSPACLPTLTR